MAKSRDKGNTLIPIPVKLKCPTNVDNMKVELMRIK